MTYTAAYYAQEIRDLLGDTEKHYTFALNWRAIVAVARCSNRTILRTLTPRAIQGVFEVKDQGNKLVDPASIKRAWVAVQQTAERPDLGPPLPLADVMVIAHKLVNGAWVGVQVNAHLMNLVVATNPELANP